MSRPLSRHEQYGYEAIERLDEEVAGVRVKIPDDTVLAFASAIGTVAGGIEDPERAHLSVQLLTAMMSNAYRAGYQRGQRNPMPSGEGE